MCKCANVYVCVCVFESISLSVCLSMCTAEYVGGAACEPMGTKQPVAIFL